MAGGSEAISETQAHDEESMRRHKIRPKLSTKRRKISIRTDNWKYIYVEGKQGELYDLKNDPGESRNIISSEPEAAIEMRSKIMAHIEFEDGSAPSEKETIRQKIRQLKNSGKI